jgi:hypothetical protein
MYLVTALSTEQIFGASNEWQQLTGVAFSGDINTDFTFNGGSIGAINPVPVAAGKGYQVGDVLTIVDGTASGATVTVQKIGGSGSISSFSSTSGCSGSCTGDTAPTTSGTGYTVGTKTLTGGHGTGATISVTGLTGKLIYTGTASKTFMINSSLTAEGDSEETIAVAIFKNGVEIPQSVQLDSDFDSGQPQNVGNVATVVLNTNDTIDVRIQNITTYTCYGVKAVDFYLSASQVDSSN